MSNKKEIVFVSHNELPIYCPPKNKHFWGMHPRVFIDHHNKTSVNCPYCGTTYKIKHS